MSRQMRNDKVIGGTSNNARAILYQPAESGRSETNVKAELDRINEEISEFDLTDTSLEGQSLTISEFCSMVAKKLYPVVLDVMQKPLSWFSSVAGSVTTPLNMVANAYNSGGYYYAEIVTPVVSGYTKLAYSYSGNATCRILVRKDGRDITTIVPNAESATGTVNISDWSTGDYQFTIFAYSYASSSYRTQFSVLRFE